MQVTICTVMQESHCQNCKKSYLITEEDFTFYTTMQVPPPTFCPQCRFQRRTSHINTRNLYPRVLKEGTAPVISMYSQDKQYNIVDDRDWWGDMYDFLIYGKPYDFDQSFFTQFDALWKTVPLPHLQREYATFENSDYCNAAAALKNCYLMINADENDECLYGFSIEESKDCVDFSYCNKCELSYEAVNLVNSYSCVFSDNCDNCSGLQWCIDCIGCTDCYGCIGLRQKKYHLFNKPLSKEAYEQEVAKRSLGSWKSLQNVAQECTAFFLTQPHQSMHGRNNESVDGDYIYQSKEVHESFMAKKAEHCKFAHFLSYITSGTHHAYDYTMFGVSADYVYECAWCGLNVNNLKFCIWNYGASDLEYCVGCHYSTHLFGCIGMRHKKYCILNVQYTQEEYEELLPRIKQQMMTVPYIDKKGNEYRYGEFFPSEISPFDYNQTLAREFCPLTQEEALQQGFTWHDTRERVVPNAVRWQDLPDDIADVTDDDIRTPIVCKAFDDNPEKALEHHCTQYFKIIPQELAYYRKKGLALPRYCHNSRHFHRLQRLNPFQLWNRSCSKCGDDIATSYSSERPETVYCESCYLKTVY